MELRDLSVKTTENSRKFDSLGCGVLASMFHPPENAFMTLYGTQSRMRFIEGQNAAIRHHTDLKVGIKKPEARMLASGLFISVSLSLRYEA